MECWHCSFPFRFQVGKSTTKVKSLFFWGMCPEAGTRPHTQLYGWNSMFGKLIHTYANHEYNHHCHRTYILYVLYMYICIYVCACLYNFMIFDGYIASYMYIIIYQNYGQEVSSWLAAATLSPWTPAGFHLNDMVDRGSSSLPVNKGLFVSD